MAHPDNGSSEMLDETDHAIAEELYVAPRMAFREIARRVGVSEATVRTRIRRLEDSGVLRFTAFIDPKGFGRGILCVALVDVDSAHHDDVVKTMSEWNEVVYLSTLLGEHSLQTQFSAANEEELWKLIQSVRALPGVTGIHTQVEATVHKIHYTAPRSLK